MGWDVMGWDVMGWDGMGTTNIFKYSKIEHLFIPSTHTSINSYLHFKTTIIYALDH
jgi:hypothetical protein